MLSIYYHILKFFHFNQAHMPTAKQKMNCIITKKSKPICREPNSFIALEVFGHFNAVLLQQFFFGLDVLDCALMHFLHFIGADFCTDDGVLFRLDNGTVDAVYDIVRTVLCRNQGIKKSSAPVGRYASNCRVCRAILL